MIGLYPDQNYGALDLIDTTPPSKGGVVIIRMGDQESHYTFDSIEVVDSGVEDYDPGIKMPLDSQTRTVSICGIYRQPRK